MHTPPTDTNYQGPPQPPGGWAPGDENNQMHPSPWDIECIRTRGINIQKKMLGDVINFQDSITQTFEIFFVNPLNSQDLEKWITMINNYEDMGTWQSRINLYGIKIDNCRITNLNAPTSENLMSNAVGRGQITLEIEQRICGDTSNLKKVGGGTTEHYDGIEAIFSDPDICPYLDGISEEFTFNYGKGEQVDISHSVSITPFDNCPTGVDAAKVGSGGVAEPGDKVPVYPAPASPRVGRAEFLAHPTTTSTAAPTPTSTICHVDATGVVTQFSIDTALKLARKILDENVPAFGLKYQAGQYKDIQVNDNVICYYAETQDLITGRVTMSKKITLLTEKDDDLDWTATYKHTLVLNAQGILNVTESGTVKGNKKCIAGDTKNVSDEAFRRSREGMNEWLEDGSPPLGGVAGNIYGAAALRCQEFYDKHFCNFTGPWNGCCATTTTGTPTTGAPTPTTAGPTPTTPIPPIRGEGFSTHPTTTSTAAPTPTTTTREPCSPCPSLKIDFPMEVSRNINGVGRDVSYSITFTDDPNMTQGYFATRSLSAAKDSSGIVTITETSNLTQFQEKGSDVATAAVPPGDPFPVPPAPDTFIDNPWQIIYPIDIAKQAARVKAFYDSLNVKDSFKIKDAGCTTTEEYERAKIVSTSVNYDPNGRTLSYTTKWSGDAGIACEYPDKNGIRKIEITTEDKLPQRIREEYPIIQWKMLVHDAHQTDLGERSVNVRAFLDRVPKQNRLTDPEVPTKPLKYVSEEYAKKGLEEVFSDNDVDGLIEDDMYIKLCQWGFDSRGQARFVAAINYLQKK